MFMQSFSGVVDAVFHIFVGKEVPSSQTTDDICVMKVKYTVRGTHTTSISTSASS
jgi:hypothetical protein